MSSRRLALIALACALLAYPAFVIGGELGTHIGYDAGAETALIAAASAGLLALTLGITAAVRRRGDVQGGGLGIMALIADVVVLVLVVWVAKEMIANIE